MSANEQIHAESSENCKTEDSSCELKANDSRSRSGSAELYSEFHAYMWEHVGQPGLERLGGGHAADVYAISDNIVLKIASISTPSKDNVDQKRSYSKICQAVEAYDSLEIDRQVLRYLAANPHPNLMQAISLEYPEGLYLRRYESLSDVLAAQKPEPDVRLSWYRDILSGLAHLNQLGMAHGDIDVRNCLYASSESGGTVFLCDFACAEIFDRRDPTAPEFQQGSSRYDTQTTTTDVMDRRYMASLIYAIEFGVDSNVNMETTEFPNVETGNSDLDSIIRKGWNEDYESTAQMLSDVSKLTSQKVNMISQTDAMTRDLETLRKQVHDWRIERCQQYGTVVIGHVTKEMLNAWEKEYSEAEERQWQTSVDS